MRQANTGDKVQVHYNAFLGDGTFLGSSREDQPVEFTVGQNEMIPGFEKAVIGMEEGDKKSVTIPPEDAFGSRNEKLITTISKSRLPANIEAKVGKVLVFRSDKAKAKNVRATVTDIDEDTVTLDANHPHAGAKLTVEIELVEIAK
jgi:FKBP-type peptidyl-prolyl cis-trans isomerase 2